MPSISFPRIANHLLTVYAGWCVMALALLYSFDLRCGFARAAQYYENGFDAKAYAFTTHFNLVEWAIVLVFYLWPLCVILHGALVYLRQVRFIRSVLLVGLQAVFIYVVLFSPISYWLAD